MEDCADFTVTDGESDTGNELDDTEDIEDISVSRKRNVTKDDSNSWLSEKRLKKATRIVKNVTVITVEKWKRDYDKSLNTSLWLEYEKLDREFVSLLK